MVLNEYKYLLILIGESSKNGITMNKNKKQWISSSGKDYSTTSTKTELVKFFI